MSLSNVIPDVEARAADDGGATFIEALSLRADGEWRIGSTFLSYAVVPAAPKNT